MLRPPAQRPLSDAEMTAYLIRTSHEAAPTRPIQDLDYLHERLYRTVSGVVVSDDPFPARLHEAQLMLLPLDASDFPREWRVSFSAIVNAPQSCDEETANDLIRSLIKLYLDLSERVINHATLLGHDEEAAWCVFQAKEGRPEPLRLLIRNATKWKEPLPPSVAAYCSQRAKKLLKARRGHTSLHPARVIAIARMVRDRLEFHQLHTPAASLNAAAKHIGDLIGQGQGTPKAAHRSVYRT